MQSMEKHDLDAVVVRGTPQANGYLRYLTLFVPLSESSTFVLFRDGSNSLTVTDGVQAYYAKKTSWAEETTIGSACDELLKCLRRAHVRRLGVADPEGLPHPWFEGLQQLLSHADVIDLGAELTSYRWVKSAEEIALVRQSCRAADEVWAQMSTMIRPGRRAHEVLADIEHALRLRGCDGSFNLIIPLPDAEFDRMPPSHALAPGDTFILEVSPQFGGYFSQLTSVVSVGPADSGMRDAFEAGVQARGAAESRLVPGTDIASVSEMVSADLHERGHNMTTADIGHLCGLELVEPRVGSSSLQLQTGMVLIFHPVVAERRYGFVMRADTYLIGEGGAERLTTHPTDLPECG
jgi:Xaa-Pro aminopeptidase